MTGKKMKLSEAFKLWRKKQKNFTGDVLTFTGFTSLALQTVWTATFGFLTIKWWESIWKKEDEKES